MRKIISVLSLSLFLMSFQTLFAAEEPNLRTLKNSGFIMGPGNDTYPVDKSWKPFIDLMSKVDGLDKYVDKMISVLCSPQDNKSVLFVGEPTKTFRYIWARMASKELPEDCADPLWQVEINAPLIEAGHSFVGQVEQYWNDKVLGPVDGKDAILYFSNLGQLIGMGSSSNDEDGIEQTFVTNIETGRMRAVAFINQYDYNTFKGNRRAYVMNAFAETILIEPVEKEVAENMTKAYFRVFGPHLEVSDRAFAYLSRVSDYYQPNVAEPYRTLRLAQAIVRDSPTSTKAEDIDFDPIESPNPYKKDSELEFEVKHPTAKAITLDFAYFETETRHDTLAIYDANTNEKLDVLSGSKRSLKKTYQSNHLKITFKSDDTTHKKGFKVKNVQAVFAQKHSVTFEDVRNAVLKVVQVPAWMLNRDYSLIKELGPKLDGDVVGVIDGKRDIVRLAKNGYVAGRTDEKPIASSLLVGPTGTGKSYIAKKLAEFLNMKLITIDMTSFKSLSSLDRFLDIVANHLIVNPYAIYLFEEIDKADVAVLDRLFFMLDEGIFYDKAQRPLFARGAFIMMTTNAGHDVIIKEKDNPELARLVDEALLKQFRPSFLNRFDARTIFTPFTDSEYLQLARIMVSKKSKLMRSYFGWHFSIDEATIQFLGKYGQSDIYGARPMERLIENTISTGIAEFQIEIANIEDNDKIDLRKIAGTEKKFRLTVNNAKFVEYEVDTEINDGSKSKTFFSTHQRWLKSSFSLLDSQQRKTVESLNKLFKENREF